jgi:RNA-directed DNA polymerase
MDTSSLMEQILSSDNLNRAYLQVVRNKGAEGVDGMKYTELKEHLAKNGEIIKEQLRTRKYKPQPVRRVEIPKPDGGVRNLGIPTVTDRFVQQAIAQVLTPIYEEQFHDQSYGFRPNRCAQQAMTVIFLPRMILRISSVASIFLSNTRLIRSSSNSVSPSISLFTFS